jgi:cytochrome c peroxidase
MAMFNKTKVRQKVTVLILAIVLPWAVWINSVRQAAGGQAPAVQLATNSSALPSLEQIKENYRRPKSIPHPADNGYSMEREILGRTLFFDPRLSGSNLISCASCHNPSLSWGDGLKKGIGDGKKELGRRTPTVLNLAWTDLLFWDGRAEGLEAQALGPIQSSDEMNQNLHGLVAKLEKMDGYRPLFEAAYPGQGITLTTIAKAIATFERTIVSSRAPFDEWLAGKEDAISASAKRGFALFNTKANCAACHSGWNFTDSGFHDIGLTTADIGRGKLLKNVAAMQHAFKTPTLRNAVERSPYMHDGSVQSLKDVIEYYNKGGAEQRTSKAPEVKLLALNSQEVGDLMEFLKTLSSRDPAVHVPILPK